MKKSEKKIEKKVNKKIAKNKSKIYFLVAIVALLLLIIAILLCRGYRLPIAWANPDYICVKDTETACEYNPEVLCTWNETRCCEEWQEDGTRLCRWEFATRVEYISTRTWCETGYVNKGHVSNSSRATWRNRPDNWSKWYIHSCEVIETDKEAPLWVWVSE